MMSYQILILYFYYMFILKTRKNYNILWIFLMKELKTSKPWTVFNSILHASQKHSQKIINTKQYLVNFHLNKTYSLFQCAHDLFKNWHKISIKKSIVDGVGVGWTLALWPWSTGFNPGRRQFNNVITREL